MGTGSGDWGPAAEPDSPGVVLDLVGAIVLAGGRGERLGGVDKAALLVAGRSLLDRALESLAGLSIVVVGPRRPLPSGVIAASEEPAGGGPAAGVVAGFRALEALLGQGAPNGEIPSHAQIAVLAVDHPGVTPTTFRRLTAALRGRGLRGAVLAQDGRRQYGVGIYSAGALRWSIFQRTAWHDVALRSLLGPLVDVEVAALGAEADDLDTPDDLRRWAKDTSAG
jgi:molybdopterin-guanine dinucleotide biosynthesis protein A